jgi:hypothetical protein
MSPLQQETFPAGHRHCPAEQEVCGYPQPLPHQPQLCGSLLSVTHVPKQFVWPEGHAHTFPLHTMPPPQVPQFKVPPQPSGIEPQFFPWAAQVVGAQ